MAKKKEIKMMVSYSNADGTTGTREMTDQEMSAYKIALEESKIVIASRKNAAQNKEEAIAKMVALGLTEQDLRSLGI